MSRPREAQLCMSDAQQDPLTVSGSVQLLGSLRQSSRAQLQRQQARMVRAAGLQNFHKSVAMLCLVLLMLPDAYAQRRGGSMSSSAGSMGSQSGGATYGMRRAPPPPAFRGSNNDDDNSGGGGLATVLSGGSGASSSRESSSGGASGFGTLISAGASSSLASASYSSTASQMGSVTGSSANTASGSKAGSLSGSGSDSSSYGMLGKGTSPASSSSYSSPGQESSPSSQAGSASSESSYGLLKGRSPSQGNFVHGYGGSSPVSSGSSGGTTPSQGYVTSSSGGGSVSSQAGASPSSYGSPGSNTQSQGYVTSSSSGEGSPGASGGSPLPSHGSSGSTVPSQGYVTSASGGGSPSAFSSPSSASLSAQPQTSGTMPSSSPSLGKADTNSPSPPASPTPDATPSPSSGAVTSVSGGAACGADGLSNCAGGNSDPVMYGFAGRSFNFIGDPGKIYNIISTQNMQVSMKLRLAQMWDHNGTNMEALGFMYRNYQVLVSLDANDDLKVYKQGHPLKPRKSAQHHAWRFDDGAYIEIIWELYKPGLGNTVEIETDVLRMTIWQTPAGIVDEGGMVLQAWLNFGITLIAPPANGLMHGVVGGTYDRFLAGQSAVSDPESQLYLPPDDNFHGRFNESDYEMSSFWAKDFKANLFGSAEMDSVSSIQGRSSLEVDLVELPQFPKFATASALLVL